MLKNKWYLALFILSVGLLLFIGCAKDDNDENSGVTDEQALQQLILDDSELEEPNAFIGDEDQGVDGGGGLDDPIQPLRWGRVGLRTHVDVAVEIQGDTLATITRTRTMNGAFRIVTQGVDSNNRIVYNKPMFNTVVRKAHAIRIGHDPNPRLNWRITEITPEVLSSVAPNPHTVWPVRVEIYAQTPERPVLIADITDPLNTWFRRDNLPAIRPETALVFNLTSNVADSVVGVLHPRAFRNGPHPRFRLHDDGNPPDGISGDGIFSGAYHAGTVPGVFAAGLDLLKFGTIFDSVYPYDACAWAIPYRVLAPRDTL